MKWFRFYSEVLYDRKVQDLSPTLFKAWVNFLCLANSGRARGRVDNLEDLAFALRLSVPKAQALVQELETAGLIDDGLTAHNWQSRQPESDNAAERVRNKRRTNSEHVRNMFALDTDTEKKRKEKKREEAEEETDLRRVCLAYSDEIGSLTPYISHQITEAIEEYSVDCIVNHGISEAAAQNKRSWRYVAAIVKAHKAEGCISTRRNGQESRAAELEDDKRRADEQAAYLAELEAK